MRKWGPWAAMAVLLVVSLAVGARGTGEGRTVEGRVASISSEVACPTCDGISVADSEAPASRTIRDEIRRRVEAGESDGDIRAYLVSRFGTDILLKPEASGVTGLVWALPVAGLVCALAGLAFAFRRWKARPEVEVSDADRVLVEQARRSS